MASSSLGLLRPLLCYIRRPVVSSARVSPLTQHLCPHVVVSAPCPARHYATKKSKVKTKTQTSKVNINAALVEDIISLDEVKEDMVAALTMLKDDFSRNLSIRTSPGQPYLRHLLNSTCSILVCQHIFRKRNKEVMDNHPSEKQTLAIGVLDHITINTKDGKFPLNQLGQISMTSPQFLIINMASYPEMFPYGFPGGFFQNVSQRVLSEVLLEFLCGTIRFRCLVRVTREHRENLAKLAKQFSNKAKESVRRARSNTLAQVKRSKEGVSEDTIRLIEKQQMADTFAADIDKQLASKTKELLG
ncbi:Ribosome-recycling factor, mitochondrial [Bagarius yarrelli]|uniref:Ribosome-recycling factor, mitochondrial n=1 Tax=Bagarius yarrelli TaxID=175774 RepID=A0A556VA55_BAGYA|nr:Ribosome-recycling factor, mitochondrial [Bagarius yarrelli]